MLIAPLGGQERKLAEILSPYAVLGSLAWSPDGRVLAVPDRDTPGGDSAIVVFSTEGRGPRRLTSPPAQGVDDYAPAFSPDGRTLAFVRAGAHGARADLLLVPLASDLSAAAQPRVLMSHGVSDLRHHLDGRRTRGNRGSWDRHPIGRPRPGGGRRIQPAGKDRLSRRRERKSGNLSAGRPTRLQSRRVSRPEHLAPGPDGCVRSPGASCAVHCLHAH